MKPACEMLVDTVINDNSDSNTEGTEWSNNKRQLKDAKATGKGKGKANCKEIKKMYLFVCLILGG